MLFMAVAVFVLVAGMGAGMAIEMFKGRSTEKGYALLHAGFALLGSAFVITVALEGNDQRLFGNIGLAVVIIALGLVISFKRKKGKSPKGLVLAHGGLAAACFALLVYNTFVPA